MDVAEHQHFAWLARSFGRTDYLPLTPDDLGALSSAGEYVEKYPGTHLFEEGGTLDEVVELAGDWFRTHFRGVVP